MSEVVKRCRVRNVYLYHQAEEESNKLEEATSTGGEDDPMDIRSRLSKASKECVISKADGTIDLDVLKRSVIDTLVQLKFAVAAEDHDEVEDAGDLESFHELATEDGEELVLDAAIYPRQRVTALDDFKYNLAAMRKTIQRLEHEKREQEGAVLARHETASWRSKYCEMRKREMALEKRVMEAEQRRQEALEMNACLKGDLRFVLDELRRARSKADGDEDDSKAAVLESGDDTPGKSVELSWSVALAVAIDVLD